MKDDTYTSIYIYTCRRMCILNVYELFGFNKLYNKKKINKNFDKFLNDFIINIKKCF